MARQRTTAQRHFFKAPLKISCTSSKNEASASTAASRSVRARATAATASRSARVAASACVGDEGLQ